MVTFANLEKNTPRFISEFESGSFSDNKGVLISLCYICIFWGKSAKIKKKH